MKTFLATLLLVASTLVILQEHVLATVLKTANRQKTSCSNKQQCNVGFNFRLIQCNSGTCEAPSNFARSLLERSGSRGKVGTSCTSFRECRKDLVCVGGNPIGTCRVPKGMLGLSTFIVNLIQEDYTPGKEDDPSPFVEPEPTQPTPLLTSRAIAIIYFAVHDAFGILSGDFTPRIFEQIAASSRRSGSADLRSFSKTKDIKKDQIEGTALIAGLTAARLLYPDCVPRIKAVQKQLAGDIAPIFAEFGKLVGEAWFEVRSDDGSELPLTDFMFEDGFLRHQADPNFPLVNPGETQDNLGRFWGSVRPFILSDVSTEAFLEIFPSPESDEYRENLAEVTEKGQCNDIEIEGTPIEDIGLFWGYDGAPLIGVPPRLYLQVVLAVEELTDLSFKEQVLAFAAVGGSMADAGIAAWLWKFEYDLWRPTLGVREDEISPDPDWNPRGIGLTNILPEGAPASIRPPFCVGINPNFPAYPSGHASFGTAAFTVLAKLLGKKTEDISVTFTSDEFNGVAVEGTTGEVRKIFTQTFTLAEGVQQNLDSRVFLGVHWRFDSDGGAVVGELVADIAAKEFKF